MENADTDNFVRRRNVARFKRLSKAASDEVTRQRILKLLAEEQQKQKDAGDGRLTAAANTNGPFSRPEARGSLIEQIGKLPSKL
jgi:hypothetical protein